MFIKDGKSLFSNTGLIISIIILTILLIISYNKCIASPVELFEPSPTITNPIIQQSTQPPQNVRINISGNTIVLNFSLSIANNEPLPKKFIVVLAQYDSKLKNTGNNKFFLSNEYELNTSVAANQATYQTNLCTLVNGLPSCKYTFKDLDILDVDGNLYYYKVGIAAVYDWGNSSFITPYNVNSTNKLFTLDTSIEQQSNVFNEFLEYKKQQNVNSKVAISGYNNTLASADGQYELIKSQLGNYPSNLVMDSTSAQQNLLNDLVDKSMAQGLLNINVATNKVY